MWPDIKTKFTGGAGRVPLHAPVSITSALRSPIQTVTTYTNLYTSYFLRRRCDFYEDAGRPDGRGAVTDAAAAVDRGAPEVQDFNNYILT